MSLILQIIYLCEISGDYMCEKILELWPEINWINNPELKENVIKCWEYAISNSVFAPEDLQTIPFSLMVNDSTNISFLNHKRTCVRLSVEIAKIMKNNFGDSFSVEMDVLIAGAILADIGKLSEYDKTDGKLTTSKTGNLLRHPFSGVAIADRFGIPAEVLHIIAYHAKEGDMVKRSVEAIIVHHADFVSFEPFKI